MNLYVFVWDKETSVAAIKREGRGQDAGRGAALPRRSIAPAPAPPLPADAAPRSARPGAIDGKVGKADTLGKLLKKSGLSAAEADEVIRALSGVLDFKRSAPARRSASSAVPTAA